MDPRSIEIILTGPIPSKKNLYKRAKSTRGRRGMFKDEALAACIDSLAQQVPAAYRNLRLEHPVVLWQFTMPVRRQDRDNMKTTILDILKTTGVIQDDNIAHYNGKEVMLPAIIRPSEEPSVRIRLRPAPDVRKAA